MRGRLMTFALLAALSGSLSAQQPAGAVRKPKTGPAPSLAPTGVPAPNAADAATIAEVLAFEKDMEAAVVRGDVKFLDRALTSDFIFTHGDGWTTGGAPLRVDTRADWMATVAKAPYASRVLDSVKTEVHGDVVITYGRYVGRFKDAAPGRRTFTVWYERVYARRDGKWQYLSHRTVDGPVYEKD